MPGCDCLVNQGPEFKQPVTAGWTFAGNFTAETDVPRCFEEAMESVECGRSDGVALNLPRSDVHNAVVGVVGGCGHWLKFSRMGGRVVEGGSLENY